MIVPMIEINVVLKEMRLKMAQVFSESEGVFSAEAKKALDAALTPENIERLLQIEARKFVEEVAKLVFGNYELKHAIADKIAKGLVQKFEE